MELRDWLHDSRLQHAFGVHGIHTRQRHHDLRLYHLRVLFVWLQRHSGRDQLPVQRILVKSVRLHNCELQLEPESNRLHDRFRRVHVRRDAYDLVLDWLLRHRHLDHVWVQCFVVFGFGLHDCKLRYTGYADGLRNRQRRYDVSVHAISVLLGGLLRHCKFDHMSGHWFVDGFLWLHDCRLWHAYGVHGLRCGLGQHDVWVCVHVDLCDGLHWRSCVYCMWI